MKKRLFSFLLAGLLLLTGCWQDIPEENPEDLVVDDSAPEQEEVIPAVRPLPEHFSLPYDPELTLDPLSCPDGPHQAIGALLYQGLFALDAALQPENVLCAEFSCDETKTIWTFRLRGDVFFSNGSQLTAADAAATLNRARETARYRARLANVETITYADDTVTVTLRSPNAAFPALLDIPIVKAGTEQDSVPLGTGPYCFTQTDAGPLLSPSAYGENDGSLPLENIHLSVCSGASALQHQFSSHQIQLITADLTAQDAYSPSGSVQVWDADTTILQFIGFNTASPLFSSADLRNALGLGIDRQTLVTSHMAGHAIAAQSPISPLSPLYPHTLDTEYSASTFREAMAAAGYDTGNIREAALLVNGDNPYKVSAARYLADALSVCDIKITVNALPWEEYTAALTAGEFDLYYGEVKLTADWDLSPLVGTDGSMNYGGYSSAVMTILLSQFASSDNPDASLRSLCRYLQAQAPVIPLCFKRTSVLTETGVADGLTPTAADPFHSLEGITIHLSEGN